MPIVPTMTNMPNTFNSIFDMYSGTMLKIAYGITRDKQLAEDAVQESFLRITKNLERLEDIYSLILHLLNIYNDEENLKNLWILSVGNLSFYKKEDQIGIKNVKEIFQIEPALLSVIYQQRGKGDKRVPFVNSVGKQTH